jgi:hypothetical protein
MVLAPAVKADPIERFRKTMRWTRESRLARWFAIPPDLTRSQLVVKLDYYV